MVANNLLILIILQSKWRKEKVRIEVSHNFSTVDIYKGEQLVSAIDAKEA